MDRDTSTKEVKRREGVDWTVDAIYTEVYRAGLDEGRRAVLWQLPPDVAEAIK